MGAAMRPLDTPCEMLPATFLLAARRAVAGRCPRCGGARLFRKWLTTHYHCPACAQDWSHARADDIPAYVSILLTGHILAPLIVLLAGDIQLTPLTAGAVILPLATAMVLAGLQPIKGAVIALQWWLGMQGFRRERPDQP
jgi:uncharacterized protein (DUF983 family)